MAEFLHWPVGATKPLVFQNKTIDAPIPVVASVTIEWLADGIFAASQLISDDMAIGLAKGDLAGALEFARERLTTD